MLALVMISMLALSLYQSLRIGFRARATAHDAVATMRRATVAMEILRKDFEGALPPKGILAGPMIGYSESGGEGEADLLEFFSVGADPGRLGDIDETVYRPEGIRRVQLSLEPTPERFGGQSNDGSFALVRRVTTNLLAPTEVIAEPEIICRNVRSFAIRYFDSESQTWAEEWDSTLWGDVLPTAVEVIMELDPIEGDEPIRGGLPYRVVRVFPLPCAEAPAVTDETGLLGS